MRKILCVLLVALVLMETAFAEVTFTMRCGIQFGDSKETVLEKDDLFANGTDEESDSRIYVKDKRVANIDGWNVEHSFNEDGSGLRRTEYTNISYFFSPSRSASLLYKYNNLVNQLREKYGEPQGYQDEKNASYKWTIWNDDESAVVIGCKFKTNENDGVVIINVNSPYYGMTNYGFEEIEWWYMFYTPEEATELKTPNSDI